MAAVRRRRNRGTLKELREQFQLSQAQVATELGSSQPAVLKAERSPDPQVGSVRRFVSAIGQAAGEPSVVRVIAQVGQHEWELQFPADGTSSLTDSTTEGDTAGSSARRHLASRAANEPTATRLGKQRVSDAKRKESESIDASFARLPRRSSQQVADNATVWRLRAWDDPSLEAAFLDRSVITVTADELGDLTGLVEDSAIRQRLLQWDPELSNQALGVRARYVAVFRSEMTAGDLVVVPLSGRRVAVGTIASEYRYVPDEVVPALRHQRDVTWTWTGLRSELDDDVRSVVNSPGTVCRIDRPGVVERLAALGVD
jgi:transcriptional regulator with XRE-family HTH domain